MNPPTTLQHDFEELLKLLPVKILFNGIDDVKATLLAHHLQKCAEAYKKGKEDAVDFIKANAGEQYEGIRGPDGEFILEVYQSDLEAARGDSTTA